MKQRIILCLFTVLLITSSCKKENAINEEEKKTEQLQEGVSISSKGFLVFKTAQDIVAFGKILNSKSKDKLLLTLKEKGFKSRSSKYSTLYARNPNSIYSSIFNQDGLLEVEDIILKISDDDKFLFTLKEELYNSDTYNKLVNEIYVSNKMNKINVNRSLQENFDLVEFIDDKPYGELEPLNNAQNRRPMFGSVKSNCGIHSNENCIWEECTVTHYFFWFVSEVEESVETPESRHCLGD